MYHTLALTQSIPSDTETDLAVVQDQIIQVQNQHFLPPDAMNLYAAFCLGTDLQTVKLETPRLRQISNPYLRPIQPTLVGANDASIVDFFGNPLFLNGQEEIEVKAKQDNAGAQRVTVGLFLGGGLTPMPQGDVVKIRATSTTAATANKWSQIDFTLEQKLPTGRYAVACVEHISANSQLVRVIFDGQYYRPGGPGLTDENQRLPDAWKDGYLGKWGEFSTYSNPRIEVLCNAADASHTLYLHVVKVPGS